MSEDDTFKVLKRIPHSDMMDKIVAIPRLSPVVSLGGMGIQTKDLYPDILRHYEIIKTLEENGWTFDDFCVEAERKAIVRAVDLYNQQLEFPHELIDRAKKLLPDVKFTPVPFDQVYT